MGRAKYTREYEILRRCDARGASFLLEISRACVCVYFARPTIAIAKIRDYLQSRRCLLGSIIRDGYLNVRGCLYST